MLTWLSALPPWAFELVVAIGGALAYVGMTSAILWAFDRWDGR